MEGFLLTIKLEPQELIALSKAKGYLPYQVFNAKDTKQLDSIRKLWVKRGYKFQEDQEAIRRQGNYKLRIKI
jgi:hypothetical protein